jgi:hypothetical protein
VYAFEDGRTNQNPTASDVTMDGQPMSEDLDKIPVVTPCPSSEDERRAVGCFAPDPYESCKFHDLDVVVDPKTIAEPDADEKLDGKQLYEAVWVNYYVDGGDLVGGDTQLLYGQVQGYNAEHKTQWAPPEKPGLYTIWAVVRDSRGGASVHSRLVRVEAPGSTSN